MRGERAARLHLAGPSLSQQISNLERELGTQLLVRDRRHVELTPAGSQFLTDAREVLGAAARAFDRTRKGGGELPLRLGYVSWLPPEAAAMPDLRVRVDEWVLPSHTQAARVAEGSLDLAIAWVEEAELERQNLTAHLLWYESLEAVMPPRIRRLVTITCRHPRSRCSSMSTKRHGGHGTATPLRSRTPTMRR